MTFPRVTRFLLPILTVTLLASAAPAQSSAPQPKYGPPGHPRAVPLSQDSQYFRNPAHPAPDFWALIPYYVPQFHGAACSVASVTMTVNAAISQGARQHPLDSEARVVDQKAILDRVKTERWKDRIVGMNPLISHGLTLDQLERVAEAAFREYGFAKAKAEAHRFQAQDETALKRLKTLLKENEKSTSDYLIANYDQKVFTNDSEVGHISPIGAYDEERGQVLILDPDREYYEPYWVSVETFLAGIRTLDRTSGKIRGIVRIRLEGP